jgi:predicted enzyme related to lactoylglutathione lyase
MQNVGQQTGSIYVIAHHSPFARDYLAKVKKLGGNIIMPKTKIACFVVQEKRSKEDDCSSSLSAE